MSLQNLVGQTLDNKYLIESELGKGGMGAVYFATHIGTERPVAVKVIVPEYMERPEFVERFRREARAAGRLRHPNVVDVTDFGIADTSAGKVAYLVMEYLDGCTLGEILAEEKNLPLGWTLDILEQVCSAVHEAHTQGIIHRDLKPDNIWLEPNQRGGYTVKVLDFGIAKLETAQAGSYQAETNGDILPSGKGTQPALKNITLGDGLQTQTFSGVDAAATISQMPTVADKHDTLIQTTEAGTLIQPLAQIDPEGGTVILPDNNKTNILDNEGTKLLSNVSSGEKHGTEAKISADLTRVGSVLGTPLYMSPEQCRGEKLDPRSDIYSLAVIAYQMLSGKTPFDGEFTEVMRAHQEVEPPKLDAKKTPKKVKKVIKYALAKTPDERPQTAEAFVSKLRASSEGISELLRKGLVIYSEHLFTFLLVAFLVLLPVKLLTIINAGIGLLHATQVIPDSAAYPVVSGGLGLLSFFVQIFTAAVLVGVMTWLVAQILAVPLRPISLGLAFKEVKARWKPLLFTVTVSTLLALFSWSIGFIGGGIISLIIAIPLYYYVAPGIGIATGVALGALGAIALGLYVTSTFMLVAPSVMIENLRGIAAFRRSSELVKRSFRTVLGMSVLVYLVPTILAGTIALSVGAVVKSISTRDGAQTTANKTAENEEGSNFSIKLQPSGARIEEGKNKEESEEEKRKEQRRQELTGSIFELLWMPITLLISSFTSLITGLLYFKTRQAGGQSMNDLLEKFENVERPQSNWQKRLKDRLIQSGRQTSNPD